MSYALAAQAALSIWASTEASKARAANEIADIVAQRERDNLMFNRNMQAFFQNQTNLGKQKTVDDMNISLAAAEARDNLTMAKVGSNLSGPSMNELDNEISRGVNADKVAAQRSYEQNLDTLNQNRIAENENALFKAKQLRTTDYARETKNAVIGAAAPFAGKALGKAGSEYLLNKEAFIK